MGKPISPAVYTYIRIASTFGLTMAMNIYIFSVVIGGWLDNRFDTEPIFGLIMLFVALGMGFWYLIRQINVAQMVEKENMEAAKKREDEE